MHSRSGTVSRDHYAAGVSVYVYGQVRKLAAQGVDIAAPSVRGRRGAVAIEAQITHSSRQRHLLFGNTVTAIVSEQNI